MTRAGTGKTYASAFALREENPKKALFLVHREQIAKQAIKSYKKVFGNTKTFGLLSGNSKEYDADYLFSTMQMMAKPETLARFAKDEFDTIIIDEVHRAGAESYQRIISYFEPKFWLGMTASPDRTDDFDIYNLFDHNIAYEIRLQQALEENLLCPFHYFGITDLEIDGEIFDDNAGVAAVIRSGEKIFATQRGYGEFKGGWEFPGGKMEEGETLQEALKREIMEELDTIVDIGELIDIIEYDYPTFHLIMHCFWCTIQSGELVLKEHNDAKWLEKEDLDSVDWLPADVMLVEKIREIF